MSKFVSDLGPGVLRELADFVLAEELGSGMSRTVFNHPTDPKLIIKVENSAVHFQNVMEWEVWRTFEHCPNVRKWLTPCHYISHSGTFLVMSKTEPLTDKHVKDLKLPTFLTDHKRDNYGVLNGKIVCRDYGLLTLNPDMRMKKWQGS